MDDNLTAEHRFSSVPYYALRILPLVVLVVTGISLWDHPDRELLYTFSVNQSCLPDSCISIYSIELGNTGKSDIPQLSLRLHADAVQDAIIQPTVRRFGKLPMPAESTRMEGYSELRFGPVERGKNVVVTFAKQSSSRSVLAESDVISSIDAGGTPILHGDPNATRFGRVLAGIGELL